MERASYINAIIIEIFKIMLICIEVWIIAYASGAFYKRKLSDKAFLLSVLLLLIAYVFIMQYLGEHLKSYLWLKYAINIIIILLWLKIAYLGSILAHCFLYVYSFIY